MKFSSVKTKLESFKYIFAAETTTSTVYSTAVVVLQLIGNQSDNAQIIL